MPTTQCALPGRGHPSGRYGIPHPQPVRAQPNTFFTANELYQKIWGKDSLGDVRTVQVHIHNLRSKIEPDPQSRCTCAMCGAKGYVFRPEGKQE